MILQELLASNKISQEDIRTYTLFAVNEQGDTWLKEKIAQTFMEEPPKECMSEGLLGLYEGRRSLLREIKYTIDEINRLIREQQNDNGRSG